MADFSSLIAEVQRDSDVKSSAITALNGIADAIDAAVATAVAANDAVDLTAITDLTNQLRGQTDALAAAIPAGTPAQP